jgi:hypothetical protein
MDLGGTVPTIHTRNRPRFAETIVSDGKRTACKQDAGTAIWCNSVVFKSTSKTK